MRQGLLLSDLHIGSMFSMWPEGFPLSSGAIPILNSGQAYINTCYRHMLGTLPERLDFLILNGDMVEGKNYADDGAWILEPHTSFQIRAAYDVLKPLLERADAVYMMAGSRYHVGHGQRDEESLGEIVGATLNEFGGRVWPWLLLNVDGVFLDIAHRQSVMLRYKSTPPERELQFSNNIIPALKEGCDAVYRAHGHQYVEINVDGQISVALPAWKLPDHHCMLSISPNRKISRLFGSVLVTIQPEVKAGGEANAGAYIKNTFLSYKNPGIRAAVLGEGVCQLSQSQTLDSML